MGTDEGTLFYNGKIYTAQAERQEATAMIVKAGKISWIGNDISFIDDRMKLIDLQGKRVIPGLIDAHMHPLLLAKTSEQIACTPPLIHSIADIIVHMKQKYNIADRLGWIEGFGFDEGKLAEGRSPNRWDLDLVTTTKPVIITRTCGHIVVVNSVALKLAGINKDTPNPPGGVIVKDSYGEPTGILKENARELIYKKMHVKTAAEEATSLAVLSTKLLASGITAITEMMGRTSPNDYFKVYQLAMSKGLKQRTVVYYLWEDLKDKLFITNAMNNRHEHIHIGGIKLFAGGSISGKTAWVDPPFFGADQSVGIKMTSKEELLEAGFRAKKENIQLVVHAMGERATELIVNTFYQQKQWLADGPSVRIEHAAMVKEKTIKRAAKAGIAFVSQPIFLFAEIESYLKNLGMKRMKQTYPYVDMLQAGVKVAFSSDAPATSWNDPANPFIGIQAAVTRRAYNGTDTGQEQRVDVRTAIDLYTRIAQEVTRIPNIGQLKQGYFADFVVLDQDIFQVDDNKLATIQVERTYIGGELVYKRADHTAANFQEK